MSNLACYQGAVAMKRRMESKIAKLKEENAELKRENERLEDAYEKILKGDWDQEVITLLAQEQEDA